MPMCHRRSIRLCLLPSIAALTLAACSFSYSSGSAPPSHSAGSGQGKAIPKHSGARPIDQREKQLPSRAHEKPIAKDEPEPIRKDLPKAEPEPPPKPDEADTDDAPRRDDASDDGPRRHKPQPKRTKPTPRRTPPSADDDSTEVDPAAGGNTSMKARTKPTKPTGPGTLVAPE